MLLKTIEICQAADLLKYGVFMRFSAEERKLLSGYCETLFGAKSLSKPLSGQLPAFILASVVRLYHYQGDFVLRQALVLPLTMTAGNGYRQQILMQTVDDRVFCFELSGMHTPPGLLLHIASLLLKYSLQSVANRLQILYPQIRLAKSDGASHERERFTAWLAEWEIQKLQHGWQTEGSIGQAFQNSAELTDAYVHAVHRGMVSFYSQLDPGVRAFSPPYSSRQASCYNYYLADSPEVRRNRIQAAQVLPVLKQLLADWQSPEDDEARKVAEKYQPVLKAIDAGKPLFACLAQTLGVPENVIRTLSRWQFTDKLEQIAVILQQIPPELRPRHSKDFSRLQCVHDCFPTRQVVQFFDNYMLGDVWTIPFVRRTEARWWLEVARHASMTSWQKVLDQFHEDNHWLLVPFIEALARAVKPGGANELQVAITLFEENSLSALIRMTGQWRQGFQRLMLENEKMPTRREIRANAPWPFLWKKPRQCGNRLVVPLLSEADLREEGMRLQHCVVGYSNMAARGKSFFFSLRDTLGNACSTLEIGVSNATDFDVARQPEFRIREHRALNNGDPEWSCQRARDILLGELRRGNFDVSLPAFWRRLRRCGLRNFSADGLARGYAEERKARVAAIKLIPGFRKKLLRLRAAATEFNVDYQDAAAKRLEEEIMAAL